MTKHQVSKSEKEAIARTYKKLSKTNNLVKNIPNTTHINKTLILILKLSVSVNIAAFTLLGLFITYWYFNPVILN